MHGVSGATNVNPARKATKGEDMDLNEMFIGVFKAKNKEIESYNSNGKHPSNDWLEGCNEDLNNLTVEPISKPR